VDFDDVMREAGMKGEKLYVSFGPFAYSRDEYRFWHNLHVGSWEFSLLPDVRSPCFHITDHAHEGTNLRVEADWRPPPWLESIVDTARESFAHGFDDGVSGVVKTVKDLLNNE
jgi:hypothetical protein